MRGTAYATHDDHLHGGVAEEVKGTDWVIRGCWGPWLEMRTEPRCTAWRCAAEARCILGLCISSDEEGALQLPWGRVRAELHGRTMQRLLHSQHRCVPRFGETLLFSPSRRLALVKKQETSSRRLDAGN